MIKQMSRPSIRRRESNRIEWRDDIPAIIFQRGNQGS
jgi:hypothetical protein